MLNYLLQYPLYRIWIVGHTSKPGPPPTGPVPGVAGPGRGRRQCRQGMLRRAPGRRRPVLPRRTARVLVPRALRPARQALERQRRAFSRAE
jgi:hypothetical protein